MWGILKFPHPESAAPNGILAVGGDLKVETLVDAYSRGIFPWPQEGTPLLWFSPPERGVLIFDHFRIPKSVQRLVKKNDFKITFNTSFKDVIENCSKIPRDHESGTWILPSMIEAYVKLHSLGYALSIEAWKNEELVGGLYGVLIKGVFSGESMFFKESGASKLCLIHLVEHLKSQGHEWMDIQMVTPVLELFGGEYISRQNFLNMLSNSQT